MIQILTAFASRVPRRIVGALALVGLIAGAGWWVRGRIAEAAADRIALGQARQQIEATARRLEEAEALGKADAAAAIHYANQSAAAARTADQLRAAVFAAAQRGELVTTPDEDPADASPAAAAVLSPRMRLCFNAAVTGDPDDVAACEAGSGDAPSGVAMLAAEVVR